jgi:hypothetical protein
MVGQEDTKFRGTVLVIYNNLAGELTHISGMTLKPSKRSIPKDLAT